MQVGEKLKRVNLKHKQKKQCGASHVKGGANKLKATHQMDVGQTCIFAIER